MMGNQVAERCCLSAIFQNGGHISGTNIQRSAQSLLLLRYIQIIEYYSHDSRSCQLQDGHENHQQPPAHNKRLKEYFYPIDKTTIGWY